MKIAIKRAYEKAERSDGFRVLIDRLWPRGVSKSRAKIDLWMKEVAPSSKLRSWFHKDKTKRLAEFEKRYTEDISDAKAMSALKKIIQTKPRTTLITAVKDIKYSHVPILVKKLKQ
jgi:uncharacterized protein YeaO (DUF488 family)